MVASVFITNEISVNPEHVVSINRDYYEKYLLVKTVLGDVFEIQPNYGESIYDTHRRVSKLLNNT